MTARFLLAGACDSYVRCVGWKPRLTHIPEHSRDQSKHTVRDRFPVLQPQRLRYESAVHQIRNIKKSQKKLCESARKMCTKTHEITAYTQAHTCPHLFRPNVSDRKCNWHKVDCRRLQAAITDHRRSKSGASIPMGQGGHVPQYMDWGDIITNAPPHISRVISATFYPCNIFSW